MLSSHLFLGLPRGFTAHCLKISSFPLAQFLLATISLLQILLQAFSCSLFKCCYHNHFHLFWWPEHAYFQDVFHSWEQVIWRGVRLWRHSGTFLVRYTCTKKDWFAGALSWWTSPHIQFLLRSSCSMSLHVPCHTSTTSITLWIIYTHSSDNLLSTSNNLFINV